MKLTYLLLTVLILVVAAGVVYTVRPAADMRLQETAPVPSWEAEPVDNTQPWPPRPSGVKFDPVREQVRAKLATNKGDIQLVLDGTRAPLTVGNFVHLANKDFYDGTRFHRVIPEFMIQAGDPLSKQPERRAEWGTGGHNYKFPDEINAESYGLHEKMLVDALPPQQAEQLTEEARKLTVKEFYELQGYQYTNKVESLLLKRGVVAMANSGSSTNGSQFFIITAEALPHLEGKHTPFGVVESGMEVVDEISQVETDDKDIPKEPVVVEDVVVFGELGPGLETLE